MKNRIRLCITMCILFIAFTVIAFAVPFKRDTVFYISYLFGVAAISLQLFAWPHAFDPDGRDVRSKFYGFPIARLATVYLVGQLALSLLFMILAKFTEVRSWIPAVLFVLTLCAAAVGFIAVDTMRDEVERQDTAHRADVTSMRFLQAKAASIAGECADPETKTALSALADSFRFSDPVSADAVKGIEASLASLMEELESTVLDGDLASARALCARAQTVLADRNRLCKLNK